MSFFRTVTLRAHHILCVQGFQGHGYSTGFVKNLARLINQLKENPGTRVRLTDSLDDICAACPHHGRTSCEKDPRADARIQARDSALLKRLGLKNETTDSFENLLKLTGSKLKSVADVKNICGKCQWQDKCSWYQSKLMKTDKNSAPTHAS